MFKSLLNLSYLFFKFASKNYEKFQEKIEIESKKNPYPFKSWFDENNRTYIDFKFVELKPDKEVKDFLLEHNYVITDYIKGLVKDINGKTLKIGKALNKIEKETIETKKKELDVSSSEEDIKIFENKIKEEINKIKKIFETSNIRSGVKQNLKIVLSQDPHDVAKMSTNRHWESCMTLGTGQYHKNVYCEVADGGFIAYLIKENDKDIENPLARIHIRRFDDMEGNSIAIPERTVYGNDVPGFLETVEIWIDNHNKVSPGIYERKGGEYSDTYGEQIVKLPESEQKIIDWLEDRNLPPNTKYKVWEVTDEYSNELNNIYSYTDIDESEYDYESTFKTKEEAEHYVQMLKYNERIEIENEELIKSEGAYETNDWGEPVDDEQFDKAYTDFINNRFTIEEKDINHQPILAEKTIEYICENKINLSDDFINKFKNIILSKNKTTYIEYFIKNYTKNITEDDLKKMSLYVLNDVANILPQNLKNIAIDLINVMVYEQVKKYTEDKDLYKLYINNIASIRGNLLKDDVAIKIKNMIMNFINNKMEEDLPFNEINYIESIFYRLSTIIENKDIDKTDIVNFYIKLFKKNKINIKNHAYILAKLGKQGEPLLPYLKKEKENIQMVSDYNKSIKFYNYVIDSIESGKLSEKYKI